MGLEGAARFAAPGMPPITVLMERAGASTATLQ